MRAHVYYTRASTCVYARARLLLAKMPPRSYNPPRSLPADFKVAQGLAKTRILRKVLNNFLIDKNFVGEKYFFSINVLKWRDNWSNHFFSIMPPSL